MFHGIVIVCPFLGIISQGDCEQAHVIYLGLKKIDLKLKWAFVHVREFDERPHLLLG